MEFYPLVQEISWVQESVTPTPTPTGSALKQICPPSPLVVGHNKRGTSVTCVLIIENIFLPYPNHAISYCFAIYQTIEKRLKITELVTQVAHCFLLLNNHFHEKYDVSHIIHLFVSRYRIYSSLKREVHLSTATPNI